MFVCIFYSKRETSGPENGASVKRVRSGDAPPSLVNRALAGLSRGDIYLVKLG